MMKTLKTRQFLSSFIVILLLALASTGLAQNSFLNPDYQLPDLAGLTQEERGKIDRVYQSLPGDVWVQLTNGLTALIRQSDASDVVSARVYIKTGSIDEGQYLTDGLSHYLEHVISGGTTPNHTEQEIKDLVQSIGGVSNAYTSYDSTVYFIETTGPHASTAVDTLLDYVFNPKFDEGEVTREKGVIIREILMGENDPDRKFWNFFVETAFQKHPVRYPVIGYKTSFEKVTRDQLMDYYHKRYVPDNAIVSVAGNVNAVDVLKQVIRQAGSLQKGLQTLTLPTEPVQVSPRFVEMTSPLAKITRVEVGFPSIELTDPDLYAMDVLAMILGQGRTSRLYKALKDEQKLVLSVGASDWTPDYVRGLFNISLSLDYNNLDKALETMWNEIEALKAAGPTLEELNRAKKKTQAEYIFSQQSVSAVGGELASSYASTGDPYFNRDYTTRIQEVSADQIKAVAQKYLLKGRVTVAVLKPADVKTASAAPARKFPTGRGKQNPKDGPGKRPDRAHQGESYLAHRQHPALRPRRAAL